MEKVEKLGSAKRFGARYGSKPKHKFAKIEKEQRKKHLCPYCNTLKVKRVAVGIWHCRKCGSKFTGKAYTISKTISFEETPEKIEAKTEELERLPKANLEERQKPFDKVKEEVEEEKEIKVEEKPIEEKIENTGELDKVKEEVA